MRVTFLILIWVNVLAAFYCAGVAIWMFDSGRIGWTVTLTCIALFDIASAAFLYIRRPRPIP